LKTEHPGWQIGEKDSKNAKIPPNRWQLSVNPVPTRPINGKTRKARQKVIDTIPCQHAKRNGKSDPEQAIARKLG
jgi:hypothetical protein